MDPNPKSLALCYSFLFIFVLTSVISTSVLDSKFNGKCILYATGNVSDIDKFTWGPRSVCGYIMFINVISLIVAVYYLGKSAYIVCKSDNFTPFSIFMLFVGNILLFLTTFVAALFTSVGFSQFCWSQSPNVDCDQIDLSGLDQKLTDYFSVFRTLEFSIWFNVCIWCVASLLSFCKVYSYHKNNDLLHSLAYEKDKLLSRQNSGGSYSQLYSDNIG